MARLAIVVVGVACAGCTSSAGGDVVGPYSGPIARFAVDRFTLPVDNTTARMLADDLNGDGTADNQFGMVFGTLAAQRAITPAPDDEITGGALESTFELQADSLDNDASVGGSYVGMDDDPATAAGGKIVNGVFASNRTRTTHVAGSAILRLPLLRAADPSVLELHGMEIDATPDGNGGYDVLVRGGVTQESMTAAVSAGLPQMFANDPDDPYILARVFDVNQDGHVSADEALHNTLLQSLLAPDFRYQGELLTSIGFAVHVIPCDTGACASTGRSSCLNRLRDNDESDIDCGGTCHKCAGGATCATAADCASNQCNGGTCAPPSCSDGISNGMETDVDCGWNCAPCLAGKICYSGSDCASGSCAAATGDFGTCQ